MRGASSANEGAPATSAGIDPVDVRVAEGAALGARPARPARASTRSPRTRSTQISSTRSRAGVEPGHLQVDERERRLGEGIVPGRARRGLGRRGRSPARWLMAASLPWILRAHAGPSPRGRALRARSLAKLPRVPRGNGASATAPPSRRRPTSSTTTPSEERLRRRTLHGRSPGARAPPSRPRRRSDPLGLPVLVVNRFFQPVQITSARRAFLLLFGGAALAIDEARRDARLRRLALAAGARRTTTGCPWWAARCACRASCTSAATSGCAGRSSGSTRKNVMLRDAHQCQYCGRRPPVRDLNIDHVLPRSRGGADSWENLVTACRLCNLRKGWKTPEEAMMRLLRVPAPPRWSSTMQILLGTPSPFEEWAPFLKAG